MHNHTIVKNILHNNFNKEQFLNNIENDLIIQTIKLILNDIRKRKEEISKKIEEYVNQEVLYPRYHVIPINDKNNSNRKLLKIVKPSHIKGLIIFPSIEYEDYVNNMNNNVYEISAIIDFKPTRKGTLVGYLKYSPTIEKWKLEKELEKLAKEELNYSKKLTNQYVKKVLEYFNLLPIVKYIISNSNIDNIETQLYDIKEIKDVLRKIDLLGVLTYPTIIDNKKMWLTFYIIIGVNTILIELSVDKNNIITDSSITILENEIELRYSAVWYSSKFIIEPAPSRKDDYDMISIFVDSLGAESLVWGFKKSNLSEEETIQLNKKLLQERYEKALERYY